MSEKEISDEELDEMIDEAFRENERKRDNCGTPLPYNREVGIQRDLVKLKEDED